MPPRPATPRPPPSCSRSSTTSCGSSPPHGLAAGEAGPDAPGHRPGPRGVPPAGRRRRRPQHWNGRGHFFAAAAEAMRRILVEHARRKQAGQARRRPAARIDLDAGTSSAPTAGRRPARPRRGPRPGWPSTTRQTAELVKLRYFAGLTVEEAAAVLGISAGTADRHWAYARAWLHRELARRRADGRPEQFPNILAPSAADSRTDAWRRAHRSRS